MFVQMCNVYNLSPISWQSAQKLPRAIKSPGREGPDANAQLQQVGIKDERSTKCYAKVYGVRVPPCIKQGSMGRGPLCARQGLMGRGLP